MTTEPISHAIDGPREIRLSVKPGDVVTVTRGIAPPGVELPFQRALVRVAAVLAKLGEGWQYEPPLKHVALGIANGAASLAHADEESLAHAVMRLLMALELETMEG